MVYGLESGSFLIQKTTSEITNRAAAVNKDTSSQHKESRGCDRYRFKNTIKKMNPIIKCSFQMSVGRCIYKKRPPESASDGLESLYSNRMVLVNLHIGERKKSGFRSIVVDFQIDMKKGRKQQCASDLSGMLIFVYAAL